MRFDCVCYVLGCQYPLLHIISLHSPWCFLGCRLIRLAAARRCPKRAPAGAVHILNVGRWCKLPLSAWALCKRNARGMRSHRTIPIIGSMLMICVVCFGESAMSIQAPKLLILQLQDKSLLVRPSFWISRYVHSAQDMQIKSYGRILLMDGVALIDSGFVPVMLILCGRCFLEGWRTGSWPNHWVHGICVLGSVGISLFGFIVCNGARF